MESEHHFVFGPFRLDPINNRLWRGDQPIELQPRPLAVLHYLVQRLGQIVTKEELLKQVWAGTYVTKTVLKVSIRAIREALEEDATAPRYIETVGREGYRFLGEGSRDNTAVKEYGQTQQPIVGRTYEVQQLQTCLRQSATGERQVVFVTGAPGVGKTTVVDLFLEQVQAAGEVWIGRGQCLEQYGEGEAYLPVLEALGQLCRGPGGKQALAVLQRYAPTWIVQTPSLIAESELETLQRKVVGATRERMLREMAEALEALTAERGLVLVVEDLHVSDSSTVELIAYLAQRRERAKLLVIGAYRPMDVVVREHPFKGIKQELSAKGRCTELRVELLSQAEVEEYIAKRLAVDTVPVALAQLIYQRTDGNALFMVNVVEYCLRQSLVAQEDGQWKLKMDAEKLGVPENVQQMIAKQVERLTEDEQQVLELASVVGHEFAVASVAAALQSDLDAVEEMCEELAQKSHFLQEEGVAEWPDGTLSGRYAFRHVLYQNVLYERIAAARRVRLHRLIGERQEQAYGSRAREIAAELAMHFERGRDFRRAVQYLEHAGKNASRRSAHTEALTHFTRGLELLKTLPDTVERARQELTLRVASGTPLIATNGYSAPEVEQVYLQARDLSRRLGDTPRLFSVLGGLYAVYYGRAKFRTALQLAEQMLTLARNEHNQLRLVWAHYSLGTSLGEVGELIAARDHLEQSLARYDAQKHRSHGYVQDPGVSCLRSLTYVLWLLGYPDQAQQRSREALSLAQILSQPYSLVMALDAACDLHRHRGERQAVQELGKVLITLAHEQGFSFFVAQQTVRQGWERVMQGHEEEGIAQIRQDLTAMKVVEAEINRSSLLVLLTEAYKETGRTQEGLTVVNEALTLVSSDGPRWRETELYRLKGELTLQQSSVRCLESKSDHGTFVHFRTESDKSPLPPFFKGGAKTPPLPKGAARKRGGISVRHCANLLWFDLVSRKIKRQKSKMATNPRSLMPKAKPKRVFTKPSRLPSGNKQSRWSCGR